MAKRKSDSRSKTKVVVKKSPKKNDLATLKERLKIEASLDRVREIALRMRMPEDLLSICEIVFKELRKLGFKDIRNTMINIHDDESRSFLNYDYSRTSTWSYR